MQGFNMGRYVPPDLEGRVTANQASSKGHSLGARANKLKSEGILTVRFECPFPIWCTTCQPEQIIGQGVRFNAEKKKVGNYYSTPVWSFRIKHTVCGGWVEVRTDPKNAEYVVVEGGRRRDLGIDKLLEGEMAVVGSGATEEEKQAMERDGGFGALEKKVEDKKAFLTQQQRVEELVKANDRRWGDPYEKSQLLRREFRVGRRKRQRDARTGEALREKYGIRVEMLEERDEDAVKAKLIDYGEAKKNAEPSSKPLFAVDKSTSIPKTNGSKRGKEQKSADAVAQQKAALHDHVRASTRGMADPFLLEREVWRPRIKRLRPPDDNNDGDDFDEQAEKRETTATALVGYDSDNSI